MQLQLPESWQRLLATLRVAPATVVVVGASHVGKSTLVHWLANELAELGKRVSVLDMDVGQSHVGPPGTLGLTSIRKRLPAGEFPAASALFFVGASSPVGVEQRCTNGLSRLLKVARRQPAQTVLINTCGYTEPGFVQATLTAADPSVVVLLAPGDELAEVKAQLPSPPPWTVVELEAAQAAVFKSEPERAAHRAAAFEQYFSQARLWSVLPVQVAVQSLKGTDAPWLAGTLVGLLDGAGICHGVGVSLSLSREGTFRILSPLPSIGNIQRVLMGTWQVSDEDLKSWVSRASVTV